MERRKYSREFKHEAVNLVTECGVSVVLASRDLDINNNELPRWVKEFDFELLFVAARRSARRWTRKACRAVKFTGVISVVLPAQIRCPFEQALVLPIFLQQ